MDSEVVHALLGLLDRLAAQTGRDGGPPPDFEVLLVDDGTDPPALGALDPDATGLITWYPDTDRDSYGVPGATIPSACNIAGLLRRAIRQVYPWVVSEI